MARRKQPTQPILGLVAPPSKPLSASRRELVRRAGTHLSIQQQQVARRAARADEQRMTDEHRIDIPVDVARILPKLGRMR